MSSEESINKQYQVLNDLIKELESKRKIEYFLYSESLLDPEKSNRLRELVKLDDRLCLLYDYRNSLIMK